MSSVLCDTCNKDSRYMAAVAENTKLRELVADMWRGMCNNYSRNCFVCRHYPRTASPNCECEFRTRMRELGIEVDQ